MLIEEMEGENSDVTKQSEFSSSSFFFFAAQWFGITTIVTCFPDLISYGSSHVCVLLVLLALKIFTAQQEVARLQKQKEREAKALLEKIKGGNEEIHTISFFLKLNKIVIIKKTFISS